MSRPTRVPGVPEHLPSGGGGAPLTLRDAMRQARRAVGDRWPHAAWPLAAASAWRRYSVAAMHECPFARWVSHKRPGNPVLRPVMERLRLWARGGGDPWDEAPESRVHALARPTANLVRRSGPVCATPSATSGTRACAARLASS